MKKFLSLFVLTSIVLCNSFTCALAEETPAEKLNKISSMYFQKNYEATISLCQEMLAEDDSYMEAYYYTAMSYYYSGDHSNALSTLEKQLEKNPRNQLALYNAACASSFLGYKEKSADFLERLLEIDIDNKSSVKKDSDFDNIRDTEKYKKLMEISVVALGEKIDFDVAPVIHNSRTLVPLRKIFETLGADVTWIDETKTVIAKKDDTEISLTIGNNIAQINGTDKSLDVAPVIKNDRTLVPLRFVSEAFGAKVGWDEVNEVVYIDYDVPDGDVKLEDARQKLYDDTVVSIVDGIFPEPYLLNSTDGMSMLIFKTKESLDLFDSLSAEAKAEYIREQVYSNYALVVGCQTVCTKVIYDGKSYYEGTFTYASNTVADLRYFPKGKKVNVVKQYKNTMNYKDFYMLPPEEQTTSVVEESGQSFSNLIQFIEPDRTVVATADDIIACEAKKHPSTDEWVVELKLSPEGQEKFYQSTKKLAAATNGDNYISIMVMGELISSPRVNEAINSDTVIITGAFNSNTASSLAILIQSYINMKNF